MDKLLLSIVVASGLCAVSSAAVRRYHAVYERKNMTDAQRHCREKYKDLVTIRDLEDMKTLNAMLDLSRLANSNFRAWIGLHEDPDTWRWSLSNTNFKPGETKFRRWKPSEPSNRYRPPHCAWINSADGEWADDRCGYPLPGICIDVKGPNVTFVLINTARSWPACQLYCREHHTDLAMVRNMEENLKVHSLVPSGGVAWIGLYRAVWTWSDGSASSFNNWKSDDPRGSSEDCVAADFSANGQWVTLNCDVESAFICYADVEPVLKRVVKVRVKRSSSVDLNDPVVMESLLKQFKQRMKDQGLNEDVKLSWKKQPDGKVFHKEEKKTKRRDEL